MRRWHGFLLAVIILAAGVGLRVADPTPIRILRLAVFDAYQRFDPRPYADSPVRLVEIGDESLARIGQWPWPRSVLAALVERLQGAGAAAIVFNLVLAEPDRTSPSRLIEGLGEGVDRDALARALADLDLPDNDAVLARAVAAGRVVTAFAATDRPAARAPARPSSFAHVGDDPRPFLHRFAGAVATLPGIEAAAAGNGLVSVVPDPDGVVRRLPLFATIGDDIYPSLAAEALRVAQGASLHTLKSSGARDVQSLGEATGVDSAKIGALVMPTDRRGELWLYDTGPVAERAVPAWQVLADNFDPARIEGRIAVIGVSAAGLADRFATPLDPVASGAILQVLALEQIVQGTFLGRPVWAIGGELLFLVVLGLVVALAFLPRRFGAVMSTVLGGTAVAAAVAFSWWAFTRHGLLLDPIYPVIVGTLVYLADAVVNYLVSESQRREVRAAFGQYVAPELVDELARNPGALRLGGERRDMTILFCDVRGFTEVSERLQPETLTHVLNMFLTRMTDRILERRGTIDKYMGDAIMAFWNAPLPDADHARHACATALAMQHALPAFNEELRAEAARLGANDVEFRCGIGLNTGPCLVGNMGSRQRFDYSVLGDSVNLASRLEGQCKTYDVPITVGEATREAAPGFAAVELDLIRVRGKQKAVRIYTLVGDEKTAADPRFRKLVAVHEAMLAAYRHRDWQTARGQIRVCRLHAEGFGLDGYYDVFNARIEELAADPPPDDWDGVYVARTK